MLTDDLWEKYLVLDQRNPCTLNQFFDIQITESQMHQIKQLCKITSIINDNEAQEIYMKKQSLKQISRWSNQESKLYKWIIVKLFLKNQFSFSKIPVYVWDQVGLYISKSPQQLLKKWQEYALCSVYVFKPWTYEEDEALKQLVNSHQQFRTKISWSQIGNEFNAQIHETFRTGKKCRDRWLNFLDPLIVKQKWSDHDIQQLFQLVKSFGKKWFKIGGFMLRTENDVKNKFYGLIHKYKTLTKGHRITRNKLKYEQRLQNLKEQSITFNLEQGQSTPCDISNFIQFEQEDLYCQDIFNLASNDYE